MRRGLVQGRPVEDHVRNGHEVIIQTALTEAHVLPPGAQVLLIQGNRFLHAKDARNVQGAGAQVVLLAATYLAPGEADTAALIQGAHALRRMELVGGDGIEIHAQILRVHLHIRLYAIRMEDGPGRIPADQPGGGGKIRHRAQLVVHVHHGHQGRVLRQRIPQDGQIGIPLLVHGQDHDIYVLTLLQGLDRFKYGRMLHRGGDDPLWSMPHPEAPEHGGVVALRAAGREDDLLPLRPEGPGDDGASLVHPLFRTGPVGVGCRRIIEILRHGLHGCLSSLR